MTLDGTLPDLEQLPDARTALAADAHGRLLAARGERGEAERSAAMAVATLRALAELGAGAALGGLDCAVVRSSTATTVTVVRGGRFVQAVLDPAHGTVAVERALESWRLAPGGDPADESAVAAGVGDEQAVGAANLTDSLAAAAERAAAAADPWQLLRRALYRGQLTDASALRDTLGRALPDGAPAAGAEPLDPALRERAVDSLLEGIGSMLSGDALSGLRTLEEVASEAQPNRSFRWLALHWSALGSLQSSKPAAGRSLAREAVLLSRELDSEAQAVSQWAAAEVLQAEGEHTKALDWLAQARVRFERLGDAWGLGRTCLGEARILATLNREDEAAEAARRAWTFDPAWDEPPVFLAARALEIGALEDVEETIRMVGTAPAERIRLIAQAVRQGGLPQADAVELLRLRGAAPSAEAVRSLELLSRAGSRLPVAREALAWLLLRGGRYAEAGKHFTALAAARLTPAIRSSVMLGLGCVAHAQQSGSHPEVEPEPVDAGATSTPALSSSAAATEAGAVFSGKLSVFAVPDLLEFLRGARRTGLLLCTTAAGTAALRFRDGRIAGAVSPGTPRVGELLIRARKLSPVVLQSILDRQHGPARTDGALGEVLVREGIVGADDVKQALQDQIGLAVKEIVDWRDGEFAFNREEADAELEFAVEVDPQEALLNAFKDMDEAARSRVSP